MTETPPKNEKPNPLLRSNGYKISNAEYAGRPYTWEDMIRGKSPEEIIDMEKLYPGFKERYPEGILFSSNGRPDFSPYSVLRLEVEGMNGKNWHDRELVANKLGIPEEQLDNYIADICRKEGLPIEPYSMHHGSSKIVEFVPQLAHSAVGHYGGAYEIRYGVDIPPAHEQVIQDSIAIQKGLEAKLEHGSTYSASRLQGHAAKGVGYGSLAVNIAEKDWTGAATDGTLMAAESRTVGRMVKNAVGMVAEAASSPGVKAAFNSLKIGSKNTPFVGFFVSGAATLYTSAAQAYQGNYDLAGAELLVGSAETAGGIVGFGAGDALREVGRGGAIALGGARFEQMQKSGIRQVGEGGVGLITRMIEGDETLVTALPDQSALVSHGDARGPRTQVDHINWKFTGFAAGDDRNTLAALKARDMSEERPGGAMPDIGAHYLLKADGEVVHSDEHSRSLKLNPLITPGFNANAIGVYVEGNGQLTLAQRKALDGLEADLSADTQLSAISAPSRLMPASNPEKDAWGIATQSPTRQPYAPTQPAPQRLQQPGL